MIKQKFLSQPLSPQLTRRVVGLVVLLALLWMGAVGLLRWMDSRPKSAAQIQKQVAAYLRKHSGRSDFSFGIPDPVFLERDPSQRRASNREANRQRRGRSVLTPPPNTISQRFQNGLMKANDYKTIYGLIGEHLWGATQMLSQEDPGLHALGICLAAEASQSASDDAYDSWLSARIAEGYLWPQRDRLAHAQKPRIQVEQLLAATGQTFSRAEETNNLIRNLRLQIAASNKPLQGDFFRLRLAIVLEECGRYKQALESVQEITSSTNANLQGRVSQMEQHLTAVLAR